MKESIEGDQLQKFLFLIILVTSFIVEARVIKDHQHKITHEILQIKKEMETAGGVAAWLNSPPPSLREFRKKYFGFLKSEKIPKIHYLENSIIIEVSEKQQDVIHWSFSKGKLQVFANNKNVTRNTKESMDQWMQRLFVKKKVAGFWDFLLPKAFAGSDLFTYRDYHVTGWSPWTAAMTSMTLDEWWRHRFSEEEISKPDSLISRTQSMLSEYGLTCNDRNANFKYRFPRGSGKVYHIRSEFLPPLNGRKYGRASLQFFTPKGNINGGSFTRSITGELYRIQYQVSHDENDFGREVGLSALKTVGGKRASGFDSIGMEFYDGFTALWFGDYQSLVNQEQRAEFTRKRDKVIADFRHLMEVSDAARAWCANYQCKREVRVPIQLDPNPASAVDP